VRSVVILEEDASGMDDARGATLAGMGDPPEPRPEQPIGDRPIPSASRRQYIKSGVLLAITGVSLYLLLPSLLSVLSSWPSLKHLDWPFAVLVLLFELASWICLWELDRIALGSTGWFTIATGQLGGNRSDGSSRDPRPRSPS
jgi:hypothetical protein